MVNGNFIEQMFTLEMARKADGAKKKYFGIHEVVKGSFSQNRAAKKYETHIDKVLAYPLSKNYGKEISHMSLQSFTTFLEKSNRDLRTEEQDDRYYPFVIEFESSKKENEEDVLLEVAQYINYLTSKLQVDERDIVITITNSRSAYVWVNPKAFGLIQGKNIHRIYFEMYKSIKKELGLKFVDESVVNSSYRLIKTPGSFYKGGYVTHISVEELMSLMIGQATRIELTREQRDIRQVKLPGIVSFNLMALYKECKDKVENKIKDTKKKILTSEKCNSSCSTCKRKCVKTLMDMPLIEKGNRNNFLVSIALGLIELNYDIKEIEQILIDKSIQWGHDENIGAVVRKIKSLIRNKTKFSCDKIKSLFEAEGLNINCNACKGQIDIIYIARNVIESIYENKGSVRHYRAYLTLEQKNLVGTFFSPEEVGINKVVIRELANILDIKPIKKDGKIKLDIKKGKEIYRLPSKFIEDTFDMIGRNIGQYLLSVVKSYAGSDDAVYISLGIKGMTEYLGFKSVKGTYGYLAKLEKLGLAKVNKNSITIFLASKKIIKLDEIRESKKQEVSEVENKKVVNGVQLSFSMENVEYASLSNYQRRDINCIDNERSNIRLQHRYAEESNYRSEENNAIRYTEGRGSPPKG